MDEQEFDEKRGALIEEVGSKLDTEEGRRVFAKILAGLDAGSAKIRAGLDAGIGEEAIAEVAEPIVEAIAEELKDLGIDEQETIRGFLEQDEVLTRELAKHEEGMANFLNQGAGLIERALELEPEKGDGLTIEEAVEILKRHGEKIGMSEEAFEMTVRVPSRPPAPGEKIAHKEVRLVLKWAALENAPPDVRQEDALVDWAASLYAGAMQIAAAGVLRAEGSLEKAASVLYWAGFRVPPGYFPDGDEGEFLDGEEALRLWVEREAGNIWDAARSVGFYLASQGKLLDSASEAEHLRTDD